MTNPPTIIRFCPAYNKNLELSEDGCSIGSAGDLVASFHTITNDVKTDKANAALAAVGPQMAEWMWKYLVEQYRYRQFCKLSPENDSLIFEKDEFERLEISEHPFYRLLLQAQAIVTERGDG